MIMTSQGTNHSHPNMVPVDDPKDCDDSHHPHNNETLLNSSSTSGRNHLDSEENQSLSTYFTKVQNHPTAQTDPSGPSSKRSARKDPCTLQSDRKPPGFASPPPTSSGSRDETETETETETDLRQDKKKPNVTLLLGTPTEDDSGIVGITNTFSMESLRGDPQNPDPQLELGMDWGSGASSRTPQIPNPQRPPQPPIARPTTTISGQFSDALTPTSNDYENLSGMITSVSFFGNTEVSTELSSLTPLVLIPQQPPIGPAAVTVASNLSMDDEGSLPSAAAAAAAAAAKSLRFRSSSNLRSGNPRSILNERYQKKYSRSFTKRDFCSIRDASEGDHIPTFTSVFVCPETGETFLSGDLLTADVVVRRDGMNWYRKKATAEFAAAGRAEDTFRFRSGESFGDDSSDSFCSETPIALFGMNRGELSAFLDSEACDSRSKQHVQELFGKHNA